MSETLDLSHCHELHITVGLFEHETVGVTDDRTTWPEAAERLIARQLVAWHRRNPFRAVRCAKTVATPGQVCLSLYHDVLTSPIGGACPLPRAPQ